MSENQNARARPQGDARLQPNANSTRRVLGDVSPNVRPAPTPGMFGNKFLAGSPLKRSFTPAFADDQGLRYLKKRKLSTETPLSHVSFPPQASNGRTGTEAARGTQVLDLGEEEEDVKVHLETGSIPIIQHAGPTEPNSPTGSANDGDDSSAERRSFSSLINYDPSSQTVVGSQQPNGLVFKGPSYAELLRLRLRVAMYKVQTNQVATPFSQLHVESDTPKSSESMSVEEHVALLRREAQMVNERASQRPFPKLLDAPVLRPTAYSSRMIYGNTMPSSPPPSCSPERLPHGHPISTPARTKMNSSDEQELTSSIVKGRVAEGLLGLRNAV